MTSYFRNIKINIFKFYIFSCLLLIESTPGILNTFEGVSNLFKFLPSNLPNANQKHSSRTGRWVSVWRTIRLNNLKRTPRALPWDFLGVLCILRKHPFTGCHFIVSCCWEGFVSFMSSDRNCENICLNPMTSGNICLLFGQDILRKETRFYGQICYSFVLRVGLSARVLELYRVSRFIFMSLTNNLRTSTSNTNHRYISLNQILKLPKLTKHYVLKIEYYIKILINDIIYKRKSSTISLCTCL